MTPKLFAELVLLAQDIREASWDSSKRYTVSNANAAVEACNRKWGVDIAWASPIGLLNSATWNDIQDWANEQTKTS